MDLDALPLWKATVDLTIGGSGQEGHGFMDPTALGTDESGRIYVFDPWMREVRRFDQRGVFETVVVGPGDGPGEMPLRPITFGMADGVIWWWELQTGRIHHVPISGAEPWREDTDLTYLRFGTLGLKASPVELGGPYWVEVAILDSLDTALRPSYRVEHLFVQGTSSQVVDRYWTSRGLRFDGGRTLVGYPGPLDQPFGVGVGRRLLRIDRLRGGEETAAPVRVRLLTETGVSLREAVMWLPPVHLAEGVRDSIESHIVRGARLGGSRTISQATRSRIREFVAAIPERLRAIAEVATGPDNSVWMELQGRSGQWLVLDSMFEPRAVATVPTNLVSMAYREDGSWWARLRGPNDLQYVARLTFAEPQS
ncbi:MAG: hypothetical protein RJQ04_22260 [Longimicrobiales bacterium]